MNELSGWLLDVYAHADGVALWLAGDNNGRHRLTYPFPITFYAAGPFPRLRQLWHYLCQQPTPVTLSRSQRQDLFTGLVDVMAITAGTAIQPRLFHSIRQRFPDLDFYDADIPLSVRFAAAMDVFPLTRCQVTVDEAQQVQTITSTSSRWQIDTPLPDLRILTIEPDSNPNHCQPHAITFTANGRTCTIPLHPLRHLLIHFRAQLKRHDPDIILTKWGDTWLFPYLIKQSQSAGLSFHPSRDPHLTWQHKQGRSYFTYGQVIYRGQQTLLYGRWHIDIRNALMFNQYDLRGTIEQAQVSGMPVQEIARRSPGAGITAMQMITALKRGILVPHTKQQVEYTKTARHLIRSDRGGLVFQPKTGLHAHVAELDFISMYPSIISRFNISPETVAQPSDHMAIVPELGIPIDQTQPGLLPQTLQPLIEKRIGIKTRLSALTHQDCRYTALKTRSTALKWLLVVAFGYAGYKRARFGRIEAHEAITAYSREAMLIAKETAEAAGYEVLHMYIDGLWLKRDSPITPADMAPLISEIEKRTGLPLALEGIYRWLAFLPSKLDERIPVPNRYFGCFTDKSLKVRGIEARRRDTPPFIAQLQLDILHHLARVPDVAQVDSWLPHIIRLVRRCLTNLQMGRMTIESLLISQTLSREIEAYKTPSPAARAAWQLQQAGKQRYPGQSIRFVYALNPEGVYAWDLPSRPTWPQIDKGYYQELALRAAMTVLQSFGVDEAMFRAIVLGLAWQRPLPFQPPSCRHQSRPYSFTTHSSPSATAVPYTATNYYL